MKNQEYLNIITNEIKKNEELLKNVNNLITFHTNVEGENSNKIHELLKNRDLYHTRIEMLKGIEKFPLYKSVINMEDEELNKIREDLINNEKKKLNIVDKKIKELENNIINADNEIGKIYELYKTNNEETYIERAKEILANVKINKKELEKLNKEQKEIINKIKNKIDLKDNEIKEIVLNDLGIPNSIEDNLNKYKPNKIDQLVVPMCDNLEILDNIISNMEKYNELKDKKTNKSILISHILESYKFNSYEESTLEWFLRDLYDSKNVNNELKVYDEEDYDILLDKIEEGLEFVERDKKSLETYKDILNLFPENILDWDLFELKTLTDKLFGFSDFTIKTLLEKIEELNNEYIELCHRRYQTIKVVEKEELLKFKIRDLVNETLSILWKNIIYKINTTIEYIDHGYNICDSVDFSKIDNQNNNIIILQNKYDTLNLINAKILTERIINKYNDIIDALYKMKSDCENKKKEFINEEENKKKELINLENNINNLYSNVSNQSLSVDDYNEIINVFKNNTIVDSIVKVEREELIKKVNKYSLINENIVNEITKTNEEKVEEEITNETLEEETTIEKETINIDKIKEFVSKLGLDNKTLKEILKSILNDEKILNSVFKLDIKGTLDKDKIKTIINEINVDDYNNIYEIIIDLYNKLDLNEEDLMNLGNEIKNNKALLLNILKSNRKVLFSALKTEVIKKILKK